MGKIRRLDSELVNQIAAGEVVERPASIVKELVENALDAGATRVRVDIEQGGLALVRVTDDGEGMSRDDALLALERHATSKIEAFDDLARLATFGFRGEALPSIASVSELLLLTRRKDDDEATEVSRGEARSAARAPGTTVEVRELFANVPARRKFLKAAPTEAAHVGESVLHAALARPDVTFVLARDGKIAREHLRSASRRERALAALGEPRLVACRAERGPVRIEAHLGPPERARAGAAALHLIVNGRPVRDRPLARAVAQAYGSVLEGGRFPIGVVYIDLPPDVVDVNVHPQKSEVRFDDARALYDALTREIFAGLAKVFAIPALGPSTRPWLPPPSSRNYAVPTTGDPSFELAEPSTTRSIVADDLAALASFTPAPASEAEPPSSLFSTRGFYEGLRFVAQVRGTFLICEGQDALYVVDQHAADERRNFDKLRRSFETRAVAVQKLLVPEVVELQPSEAAALAEHEDVALRLGVEVRTAGPSAIAVHGVPALLARARPERLVRDLLAELSRGSELARPYSGAVDLVLATMACHGSIRAGDALSAEQAQALVASLDGVDFSGHCPHGRPVLLRIPFSELERRVGR
ncbi:MAG TPA: DNA mismatch repair endonuclease MutL [Polyangiaceae bacterium]|jgi:DNA mismatch repair protein MutL